MRSFLLASIVIFSLSGCASHYGAARIISNPPGAEVFNMDDGTSLGVTPVVRWWKDSSSARQHIAVRFKKDGYYEKVTSFWLSMRHNSKEQAEKDLTLVEVSLSKKTN